jgi:iron uptake system component EfeO
MALRLQLATYRAIGAGRRHPWVRRCLGGVRAAAVAFALAHAGFAVSAVRAAAADAAVEDYRSQLIGDVDRALAEARMLHDRIAARDLAGAQKAWLDARAGWERSEVFTSGFVPELDNAIDAWPDANSGFHGIEAKLFGDGAVDATPEVRAQSEDLIAHLTTLDAQVRTIALTNQGLLNGVARLAYEVGDSKVDGGESRFSGTSLNDMRYNADGIALAYRTLFASSLDAADPKLAERVGREIDELKGLLAASDLKSVDPDRLRAATEALVVMLQAAGPKLGLEPPTLEEAAR